MVIHSNISLARIVHTCCVVSALNVHFESMCLPAPLAWYCYHLPAWFLNLNTVFANVAEILIPPLFFFPVQAVKSTAFWIQVSPHFILPHSILQLKLSSIKKHGFEMNIAIMKLKCERRVADMGSWMFLIYIWWINHCDL